MKDWNLKQLKDAMLQDIEQCQTRHERAMCKALCGREIRERAQDLAASRKLTPGEIAIASEFGFRAAMGSGLACPSSPETEGAS